MTCRYRKKAVETAQSLQKDTVVPINMNYGKKIGRATTFSTNFQRGNELPSHFTGRINCNINKIIPSTPGKYNAEKYNTETRSRSLLVEKEEPAGRAPSHLNVETENSVDHNRESQMRNSNM